MVKLILEKEDLMEIIRERYVEAELVSGLADDVSVTISVPNFQPAIRPPQAEEVVVLPTPSQPKKVGKIDLNAPARTESSLTPEQQAVNEKVVDRDETLPNALALNGRTDTVPGGAMGGRRGQLRKF